MALNLKNQPKNGGGVQQDILEVGTYPARLVRILDLGIQPQTPYQGKEKPPAPMADFTYELLDVFMVDAEGNEDETKPRWISESFVLHHPSADLATSTKRAKALDPDEDFDYDLTKMLGQPCMVTIVHKESKGKTYANVGNVTAMRAKDAAKAPDLVNVPVVFSLDDPDMTIFNKLPAWLQDKIKGNLEYKGSPLQKALSSNNDDDDVDEEGEEW